MRLATLALASNECGSVLGVLSTALTCTYLPPTWLMTFAYSFSAPTAVMVALELAAGVVPEPDEHAAASAPVMATAAANRTGREIAGLSTGMGPFSGVTQCGGSGAVVDSAAVRR